MIVISRLLSTLAALIVMLTLTGYATHILLLVRVQSGLQGMSPLTATCLFLLSISAFAFTFRLRAMVAILAATALVIAFAILGSHLVAGSDVFSRPIGSWLFALPETAIGRTSIVTAACTTLLATALLVRHARPPFADILGGTSLTVSGMALLGYLYGVGDLYALPMFNSMALNTSTALFMLSLASLFVEPDRGWAGVIASDDMGGGATRRQLGFIILPVIAGWFLIRTVGTHDMGPAIAMSLLVIVTVVPLAFLVLRDGHILNSLDRERREKLEMEQDLSREMARQLAEQAETLALQSAERTRVEAIMYRTQRMEAVGQLTGGIAHDFNNLLMAIRGNLELMQRRLPDDDERLGRYLERATAATDRGAKITGQLLAFSRSQLLDIRSVEVDAILAGAQTLVGTSLGPDVKLILDLDTAGAWIRADPDQLELALLNLAVNARDAMPDGGHIRIESEAHVSRPNEDCEATDYVAIRVIDTGCGMSEEVAAKAVEPFFTTKDYGKGSGLGLAQVYGFVRQCGGDLRIDSTVDIGTTIEILLPHGAPLKPTQPRLDLAELRNGKSRLQGKKVLVIDDDDAVRAVIVDALSMAGFDVVQASDGKSGLAMMDEEHPAAAVIDFIMPGMNGAEVARLAQARRPDLPIVFVSGYSDTVALEGIKGAVVLRKPFDVNGLSRALNEVIH